MCVRLPLHHTNAVSFSLCSRWMIHSVHFYVMCELSLCSRMNWAFVHWVFFTGTSIGKRYARTDEIGVPFAVTVDSTDSVTIRERDSKEQIRVSIDEVASVVKEVADGQSTWSDIMGRYPAHAAAQSNEEWTILNSTHDILSFIPTRVLSFHFSVQYFNNCIKDLSKLWMSFRISNYSDGLCSILNCGSLTDRLHYSWVFQAVSEQWGISFLLGGCSCFKLTS